MCFQLEGNWSWKKFIVPDMTIFHWQLTFSRVSWRNFRMCLVHSTHKLLLSNISRLFNAMAIATIISLENGMYRCKNSTLTFLAYKIIHYLFHAIYPFGSSKEEYVNTSNNFWKRWVYTEKREACLVFPLKLCKVK